MSKKVAYVTGGMGGIGTAICQRLHKDGFTVIAGCGPTRDYGKWLDEQKALGYDFHASVGNVGDWQSTVDAFGKAKAEHGSIDVLVNNAGITRDRMFVKMTPEDWAAVIETNLNSMFNVTKQVVGDMVEKGWGRIVNIASTAGQKGYPYVSAYVAAKHGVVGLTRSLALEVAKKGVTVNAVCPGYTETDILRESIANVVAKTGRSPEEAMAEFAAGNPQQRIVQPHEVADAVRWLCGEAAGSINGQSISVSGGEVM